jgi:hypothetical protein|tara:strand:+ start:97 stop:357 length:261 start_codon:yes stop_codon:yes gene_type:complete
MIKNQCKPILAKKDRRDLLQFVRKEIIDLEASAEGKEAVEEVTAELVVENLIARYPENTYTPKPKKELTPSQKKYAQALKDAHGLS